MKNQFVHLKENDEIKIPSECKQMTIWLNKGRWLNLNMDKISSYIIQWEVRSLWINMNSYNRICKQIMEIKFPFLKSLSLYGNNLESIEVLCRINMGRIQEIYLGGNFLTNINSFIKFYSPFLIKFGINNNYIYDFTHLFKKKCFKQLISLYFQYSSKDLNMLQSVHFIFKLSPMKIKELYLKNQNRIKGLAISKLRNRFPSTRLQL